MKLNAFTFFGYRLVLAPLLLLLAFAVHAQTAVAPPSSFADAIVPLVPVIAAALAPPLLMMVRGYVEKVIPVRFFPALLPIAGGLVAGLAHLVGVDASILQTTAQDAHAWETVVQGVLAGSASVGLHQLGRAVKPAADPPAQ